MSDACSIEAPKPDSYISIGDTVLFLRNGKPRIGIVVSAGPKYIGLSVMGMRSNTKILRSEITDSKKVYMTADIK